MSDYNKISLQLEPEIMQGLRDMARREKESPESFATTVINRAVRTYLASNPERRDVRVDKDFLPACAWQGCHGCEHCMPLKAYYR